MCGNGDVLTSGVCGIGGELHAALRVWRAHQPGEREQTAMAPVEERLVFGRGFTEEEIRLMVIARTAASAASHSRPCLQEPAGSFRCLALDPVAAARRTPFDLLRLCLPILADPCFLVAASRSLDLSFWRCRALTSCGTSKSRVSPGRRATMFRGGSGCP